MNLIKPRILICLACCLAYFNCEKILEPSPQGQISLDDLLKTESGILTAVNGIYNPLLGIYKGEFQRLVELGSDDGWIWRKEVEPDIFIIDPTYGGMTNIWSQHYTGITRANTVLARTGQIEDYSNDEIRSTIEGQAKFLRALYYFNLVRIFGGVPLIIEEIGSREDAELPRSSMTEVYTHIKQDLGEAINQLPIAYSGGSTMEKGRATSLSAQGLKALVHLELGEWQFALDHARMVIGNGIVLEEYSDNFNGSQENSPAVLFEVQYGGGVGATTSNISQMYAPPDFNGLAAVLPTDDNLNGKGGSLSSGNGIVQAFEEGDVRKSVILANYGLANFIDPSQPDGSLLYVNKYYNDVDPRGLSTWNFPVIRYAEMLLVAAEAMNELGYVADGDAFEWLNVIRINAGLTKYTSADLPNQDAFREALRQERRIELAYENKRFFDLNRWGILEESIQLQMDYLNLTFPSNKIISHPVTGQDYYLFPLPNNEFINNANLGEQNMGY